MLLAVEVEPPQVSNCGVFDVEATDDGRVKKIVGMVEKPAVEDAPSNLVATGCYLLDRAIFGAPLYHSRQKRRTAAYRAIALLISEGHPVRVVVHDGMRHDLSNPAGFFPRA